MTNGSNHDFRIKILVVHPDGRRQKFLVTFPERKSLKVDQRYIGLPITLRVEFVPGSIVVKPGTGHTLTVADRPVKEHSVQLNDVVGLDQYVIEFLELPEPLPVDEATRFVNINDMIEATVIAQIPIENPATIQAKADMTPTPAVPSGPKPTGSSARNQGHASAASSGPIAQVGVSQPDPEDSTALIRRLQIPGSNVPNARQYQSLEPSAPATHHVQSESSEKVESQASSGEESEPQGSIPGFFSNRTHQIAIGAVVLVAIGIFFARQPKEHGSRSSESVPTSTEASSSEQASTGVSEFGSELEIPSAPEPQPTAESPAQAASDDLIPSPKPLEVVGSQQSQVPMGSNISKPDAFSLGFDDQSGFDPMSVDQFFAAIDNSDERRIKEILDSRQVDVNLSRRRGYAALHLAAAQGQMDIVKLLIRLKADPNVIDASGATPLMWAVFRKHKAVAKFLAPRTDLKIQRQGGETAYDLARRMNQRDLLSALDPEPKRKSVAGSNRKGKAKTAAQKSSNQRSPTGLPQKGKKK